MPYIKKIERKDYDKQIERIVGELIDLNDDEIAGHLNYIIYSIMLRYIDTVGIRYHKVNALMGALDCCSREFYTRVIRPYEDKAIKKNGDI